MGMTTAESIVPVLSRVLADWRDHERRLHDLLGPLVGQQAEIDRLVHQLANPLTQVLASGAIRDLERLAASPALARIAETTSSLHPAIERALELDRSMQAQWKQSAEALNSVGSAYARLAEGWALQQEQLARLAESSASLPGWLGDFATRWDEFTERHLQRLADTPVSIGPTGIIEVAGEHIQAEQLEGNIGLLAHELSGATNPADYLARLLAFVAHVPRPLAVILVNIVLPFLLSVAGNLATPSIAELMRLRGPNPVVCDATEGRAPDRLEEFRYVTATRLVIRDGPGRERKRIGTLPRGKLVLVIAHDRWWTHVRYWDEATDGRREGWVATAHLGKFN